MIAAIASGFGGRKDPAWPRGLETHMIDDAFLRSMT